MHKDPPSTPDPTAVRVAKGASSLPCPRVVIPRALTVRRSRPMTERDFVLRDTMDEGTNRSRPRRGPLQVIRGTAPDTGLRAVAIA